MRIEKGVEAAAVIAKDRPSASSSTKAVGEVEVELVEAGQTVNEEKAVQQMNVRTKLTGIDKVRWRCCDRSRAVQLTVPCLQHRAGWGVRDPGCDLLSA